MSMDSMSVAVDCFRRLLFIAIPFNPLIQIALALRAIVPHFDVSRHVCRADY